MASGFVCEEPKYGIFPSKFNRTPPPPHHFASPHHNLLIQLPHCFPFTTPSGFLFSTCVSPQFWLFELDFLSQHPLLLGLIGYQLLGLPGSSKVRCQYHSPGSRVMQSYVSLTNFGKKFIGWNIPVGTAHRRHRPFHLPSFSTSSPTVAAALSKLPSQLYRKWWEGRSRYVCSSRKYEEKDKNKIELINYFQLISLFLYKN